MSGYNVRRASTKDLQQLKAFFRQAYGERSVMQDGGFLLWFFGGGEIRKKPETVTPLNAFIASDDSGTIVAHYGYLRSQFSHQGEDYPLVWGVSAFTLPAHRKAGLGKALVDAVQEANDCFGVIGFSEETADFYDRCGFNVFQRERFRRHIFALDSEFLDVVDSTRVNPGHRVRALRAVKPAPESELTGGSSGALDTWTDAIPASLHSVFTRRRTKAWLSWRFAAASLLDYQVRAVSSAALGRGLIVYRSIPLPPTRHRITKIVDLYGDKRAAGALLGAVTREASHGGQLYVQFDSFGPLFGPELEEQRFVTLSAEESSLFPSLYQPVGFRPNREYVGLFSRTNPATVARLQPQDLYLTQADSDRDKRASI